MRKPSIFIIGVQKCGTTTVADILSEQPEIFVPSIKETYFFCDEAYYLKGVDWYLKEYYSTSVASAANMYCDATPFYLASSEAMNRIANFASEDARFIVCLRDPVSRAYSAYWHQRRLGNENLDFKSALVAEPARIAESKRSNGRWWRHAYVEVGCYGTQLERAFDLLGRDRFLVLNETDLRDVANLQSRIRYFLCLPERDTAPVIERANSSAMPRSTRLQALITRKNPLKTIAQLLLPRQFRSAWGRKILELNEQEFKYPPMSEEVKEALGSLFVEEIAKLEKLGVTVPAAWREK